MLNIKQIMYVTFIQLYKTLIPINKSVQNSIIRPITYSAHSCCGIKKMGLTFIDKTIIYSRFRNNNYIFKNVPTIV